VVITQLANSKTS